MPARVLVEDFATANVEHGRQLASDLAAVVCWQEADTDAWHAARRDLPGLGWHVPEKSGRPIPISWRLDTWALVLAGEERVHRGIGKVSPDRWISWVILRHRATGALVYVVNTHMVSGAWNDKKNLRKPWRKLQWRKHKKALDRIVADRADQVTYVVVMGDLNRVGCTIPGLTRISGGGIDQIHVSHGLHATVVRRLDHGRSDHQPVRAALTNNVEPAPPTPRPTPEDHVNRLPANLPDLLRAEGLNVVVLKGWLERGRPARTGGFAPVGVLWHHTGSYDGLTDAQDDRQYAAWLGLTGRSDLPAPLCHLSISAEGTVFVIAAGRANHAGTARASGSVAAGDGNELYVGVECMNSGKQGWGRPQYDAMVKTAVVLSRVLAPNGSPRAQRGHRETSVTGKWDPGMLDLDRFRADIEAALEPAPAPDKPSRVELANLAIRAAIDNAQATVPTSRTEAQRAYADLEARLDRAPRR